MGAIDSHLSETTYLGIQDIVSCVARYFKVAYSISGMTDLLHRLNYSYKKPKLVPGKEDAEAQDGFVEFYNEYNETFDEFRKACKSFIRWINKYKEDLTSLLTGIFK